jgi:hypothetical protein
LENKDASKIKVADKNLYFSKANKFSRQIAMFSFFISYFVFRKQPA